MAPRPRNRARDYRAEEARRNARARALGFSSRAQMRTALAQGWQPQRASNRKIVAPPEGEITRPVARGLKGMRRIRTESKFWSDRHSRKPTSKYRPDMSDSQAAAYHAAYVDPETNVRRVENDLVSLRFYLVDVMEYYTDTEFDDRYSSLAALAS